MDYLRVLDNRKTGYSAGCSACVPHLQKCRMKRLAEIRCMYPDTAVL